MKLRFIILLLFMVNVSQGQFFKKLGDKAKKTAERTFEKKTEEKVEKTTEEAVDEVFEAPKKATKKKKTKDVLPNETPTVDETQFPGNIFSGETHYESQYLFPVTATIELEDSSADVQKMTMKQGYGKQSLITEMESGNTPIIVDMKNQSAVMLDIKAGTAQVMSLEWMEKMMSGSNTTDETSVNQPKVVKTGKTKKINGYTCYEYNIFHEAGKINAWFAPDVKFEYQDYLRGMAKMFSKKAEENPSQLLNTQYGYVMEMTAFTKENKKQSSMKVIKLEEKVRMINMDLFTIQKI
ncbi:hypothetical protein [Flavobacterium sp. U410]